MRSHRVWRSRLLSLLRSFWLLPPSLGRPLPRPRHVRIIFSASLYSACSTHIATCVGAPSYWEVHGLLFSLALLLYPRLTLLLCAAFPHYAGPASWLGWLLAPHLTVRTRCSSPRQPAQLVTQVVVLGMSTYWTSNWILCLVAIPLALAAELFEKSILLLGKDFR